MCHPEQAFFACEGSNVNEKILHPQKIGNLLMKRESHLFACHKFLEKNGSQILICLAKMNFKDLREIEIIYNQIEDYVTTLKNHAQWEEEFIFNKFFSKDEILLFFGEHTDLDNKSKKIIEELKAISNCDIQSRVFKVKQIYLDFKIFYASNLTHFHNEETNFLSMLQERATDDEIRAIDKPIYQHMSSNEIMEMLAGLFPPINLSEKKNILNDLKNFNPVNFECALPEIRKMLTVAEVAELGSDLTYE